ncbi:MAG: DUF3551 domain-containing protein [Bradyrhizobium sp.]|nr:DUF3551 domain-containing protein [Bradyrhizobium sp.]
MHSLRWIVPAIAMLGMVSVSEPATAGGFPYCIKGCDFGGGSGDCSFSTYQQCLATASGRDAWCAENPDFNAKVVSPGDRTRLSRRRY